MRNLILGLTSLAIASGSLAGTAHANVVLSGPASNAGSYSTTALQHYAIGHAGAAVTYGAYAGVSLWSLLGTVSTSTPPGYNDHNAILRYYVIGSGGGQASIVSAGEINPSFGGTGPTPIFIAYQENGGLLAEPELIVPNQPARDLSVLGSLVLTSVAANPNGPGGQSATVTVAGAVANPASYSQALLQALLPVTPVTVGGTTYTGTPLDAFLDSTGNPMTTLVNTVGTDGYDVVFALAEVDPWVGGNPNDILSWASTGTDFPNSGVARTIFPNDNRRGRWMSNLTQVEVTDIPEPASAGLLVLGLAVAGLLHRNAPRRRV